MYHTGFIHYLWAWFIVSQLVCDLKKLAYNSNTYIQKKKDSTRILQARKGSNPGGPYEGGSNVIFLYVKEKTWNRLWVHCIQNSPNNYDFHSLPFSFFDHILYHRASHTDFLLVPPKFHMDYFMIFVISVPSFHRKLSLFNLLKLYFCY